MNEEFSEVLLKSDSECCVSTWRSKWYCKGKIGGKITIFVYSWEVCDGF